MIESAIKANTGATTRFETSWLIVRDDFARAGGEPGGGLPEVFTLGAGCGAGGDSSDGAEADGKTLPVFSYEEEALLFLDLCGLRGGWRATRTGAADLAAVLLEACPDAGRVALDPIPEIGLRVSHELVSLPREDFLRLLFAPRFLETRKGSG